MRACLGSLFWMTEKSLLSGCRKADGFTLCRSRFCTVARMSISVSCNHPAATVSLNLRVKGLRTTNFSVFPNKLYRNAFNLRSYLRIAGSLEVGQQQADKHRALLLLTHKSADPKKQ